MLYPVRHIINKAILHDNINILYCPTDGLFEQYLSYTKGQFFIPKFLYDFHWNKHRYKLPSNFTLVDNDSLRTHDAVFFTIQQQFDAYVTKFEYLHIPLYFIDYFNSGKIYNNVKTVGVNSGDVQLLHPFEVKAINPHKVYDLCVFGDFHIDDLSWVKEIIDGKNALLFKKDAKWLDIIQGIWQSKIYLDLAINASISPLLLEALATGTKVLTTSNHVYNALSKYNLNTIIINKKENIEKTIIEELETPGKPEPIDTLQYWNTFLESVKDEVFIK
jgi:hypothetical protein